MGRRSVKQPLRARSTPPAATPEEREAHLINMTYDLVEQRILDGTASPSETVHFLKRGSERDQLELEKLRRENTLLTGKAEAIESAKRIEEMYSQAMKAFKTYSGDFEDEEDWDDY